jgi:ATP-binding cassette subfamily F protein uup
MRTSAAEQRAARKEAQRLERRMETLSARESTLHTHLAEAATDPQRLLTLDTELRAVVAEREKVELDWLAAAELAEP